jgi:epoxyqueuosine reductase QueG
LKERLVARLRQVGAYDVRIANPAIGFEHAIAELHPLRLWPACKSVVVFAMAMSPTLNNTYVGVRAPGEKERNVGPVPQDMQSCDFAMDRLSRLFVASITLKGMTFLSGQGYHVSFATTQSKLCAFEAGLGVYGRSGLILHPEQGNRMSIGTILTDAELEADARLGDFEPCAGCDLCVRKCPARAYDPKKSYPQSWSKEKCMGKRVELASRGLYCHNCFALCPAGRLSDQELFSSSEADSLHLPHHGRLANDKRPGNIHDESSATTKKPKKR